MVATFELGRVVATPGALSLFASGVNPTDLLARHHGGDWGNLGAFDRRENGPGSKDRGAAVQRLRHARWPGLDDNRSRQVLHLCLAALGVLMRCDGCGLSATVLKTVVCRSDRERRGVLCDGCWLPLADRLWTVPGPGTCFGTCVGCGQWVSVREPRDAKLGGKRSAWVGTCFSCAES